MYVSTSRGDSRTKHRMDKIKGDSAESLHTEVLCLVLGFVKHG